VTLRKEDRAVVDRTTAARCVDAPAPAIGEIVEDAEAATINTLRLFEGYREKAQAFAKVGADITALAAALEVLVRRSARPD